MNQRNMMNNFTDNVPISQAIQMNECKFFHYTPEDNNFYHITCQIILRGSVLDDHDYDHGFCYHGSTINYYVKCKLFSHPLIIKVLNKEIYGMDIDMNNFERKKSLSLDQILNLERDLKQILPFYLMQNHIPKSEAIRMDSNINMNQMNDNQNNFGNGNGFYQNGIVDYIYNVTQPRQLIDFNNISPKREMRPGFNRNSDSLYRNIGNNIMATPMNDNQNNVNEVGGYIQNVIHPQQQVDFNNVSPAEREMRPVHNNNRNTNISHENIKDNLMTTQVTSIMDNQKNCLPYQNEVEDTQQTDLNNFPQCQIPERGTMSDYNSLQNDVLAYDVSTTDNHRDTRIASPQPGENITTRDIPITAVDRNYDDINGLSNKKIENATEKYYFQIYVKKLNKKLNNINT
ncbi:hypothetical protein GLOIN_2v1810870 [Rhizophagus irregularis DAOM 181602=DAOM 197198]|uniref:Uncharacterized protein n=1 Tax=Rhizophagus irregularis (strain DAOM 181602 / DAOM 197198 / MUCL 43194) TaxID=747089 RepID=A0A2P4QYS8_RHIID|nr:hypothetical protein GLOIN_2v1810870 [Rhizophagus irregularis DAOM 181602=DAOM 197198]POG82752.1 hypothetical protein GLOIN_2v1810870 [Rhizophagus irregularis DAOM 181602=DAOM 197198]|eukprot:XP_025189618.1 hypothetical protein GLOIN_2v1810870 [Rhizophagus irregularis DAOM 181602=DAOM 197198]